MTVYPDGSKPNHYFDDSLGDPYACVGDHNHPDPEVAVPDLPTARLEWFDRSPNRKIGSVNGHVVYVVQWKAPEREFGIFHRLPVAPIEKRFRASDLAKLYADTHLHRAMRQLGFVAR